MPGAYRLPEGAEKVRKQAAKGRRSAYEAERAVSQVLIFAYGVKHVI